MYIIFLLINQNKYIFISLSFSFLFSFLPFYFLFITYERNENENEKILISFIFIFISLFSFKNLHLDLDIDVPVDLDVPRPVHWSASAPGHRNARGPARGPARWPACCIDHHVDEPLSLPTCHWSWICSCTCRGPAVVYSVPRLSSFTNRYLYESLPLPTLLTLKLIFSKYFSFKEWYIL